MSDDMMTGTVKLRRLLLGYECSERDLVAAILCGTIMALGAMIIVHSALAAIIGVITYLAIVAWRSRGLRTLWIWPSLLVISGVCILLFSALPQPSHARSRDVPRQFQKEHPCPSTGRKSGACPGYVRDHIKPLCAGGADATWNMQWQTTKDARIKDYEERRECRKQH